LQPHIQNDTFTSFIHLPCAAANIRPFVQKKNTHYWVFYTLKVGFYRLRPPVTFEISQITAAIMATTIRIPTQTPALKTPSMSAQLLNRNKLSDRSKNCEYLFIACVFIKNNGAIKKFGRRA